MNTIQNTPRFRYKRHLYILRSLLIIANSIALSVHILMRAIFYDLPFVLQDELLQVLNSAVAASITAIAVSFIVFAVDGFFFLIRKRKHAVRPPAVHGRTYKLAS